MTDYVYTSNFGAKDALPRGNPEKSIRGVEFETEFNAIEQSLQTKLPRPGTGAGFIPTIETSVEGNELVPTTLVPEVVVTLTDTQTLENKTIVDPDISGGTGTSQTLESPTINNPVINGASFVGTNLESPNFSGIPSYADALARENAQIAMGVFNRMSGSGRPTTAVQSLIQTWTQTSFQFTTNTGVAVVVGNTLRVPRGARGLIWRIGGTILNGSGSLRLGGVTVASWIGGQFDGEGWLPIATDRWGTIVSVQMNGAGNWSSSTLGLEFG